MDGQAGQNAGGGQYQQGGGGPVAAQTIPMVYPPSGPPGGPGQPTAGYPAGPAPAVQPPPHLGQPMPYQYTQQHQQQLQQFWQIQMQEIEQATDFKNHNLPLARIKKIMKADEDVRMIAAEAPVVFAKACEMFILELTLRSWIHTEENKRRTLQKNDIAAAITRTDIFDFLVDIVPRDELREEGLGVPRSAVGTPADAAAAAAAPYGSMIYLPPQPPHQNPGGGGSAPMQGMPPPPMMVGRPPAMHIDPSMYAHHQPRAPMPYLAQPQLWQQGPPPPMANPNPE